MIERTVSNHMKHRVVWEAEKLSLSFLSSALGLVLLLSCAQE